MNDMLCSRSVASLASADKPAKFSTATEAFRTTVSAGWRALESLSTFWIVVVGSMMEVAGEACEALSGRWLLDLRT